MLCAGLPLGHSLSWRRLGPSRVRAGFTAGGGFVHPGAARDSAGGSADRGRDSAVSNAGAEQRRGATESAKRGRANGADIAADPTRTGCVHRRFTPAEPEGLVRELCRPALAPASGPVRRRFQRKAPSPAALAVPRSGIRGGPMLHLNSFKPKPSRTHPHQAGPSGLRLRAIRVSFTGRRIDPEIAARGLLPKRVAFAAASRTFNFPVLFQSVTSVGKAIQLSASMIGRCARVVSRSSAQATTYPPMARLAVDKCG